MKKMKTVIGYIVSWLLGLVAVWGIFCSPDDGSDFWMTEFFMTKALGLGAGALALALHREIKKYKCKQ